MLAASIVSITLRGITLASKFVLVFYIAKYLHPEDLGVYGLLVGALALSIYLLGMDFYTFNTRELLARGPKDSGRLLRDQLAFHGLVYVVVLPVLMIVFAVGLVPWKYAFWFYPLVIVEHLSQEGHRVFITLSRPIRANIILLLRSGAWVYLVVAVGLIDERAQLLETIWVGWFIGGLISIGLSAYWLRRMTGWHSTSDDPIDWAWMWLGLKTSMVFLLASFAFMGVEVGGRFFIQLFLGEAMVGVYTFYSQIAYTVHTFVFTGVISILFPSIVRSYQAGATTAYRHSLYRMGLASLGSALVLTLGAAAVIHPILALVGNPLYRQHVGVYWILLGSAFVLVASYLPHYALYVRRRDWSLTGAAIIGVTASIVGNVLLIPRLGLEGAALAQLIGVASFGAAKTLFLLRTARRADAIPLEIVR